MSDRKPRRWFMWAFLAIQAFFLLFVILGAQSGAGTPTEADCGTLSRGACNDAEDLGTAVGVGLTITLWAATDIIIGITWAIVRAVRR